MKHTLIFTLDTKEECDKILEIINSKKNDFNERLINKAISSHKLKNEASNFKLYVDGQPIQEFDNRIDANKAYDQEINSHNARISIKMLDEKGWKIIRERK